MLFRFCLYGCCFVLVCCFFYVFIVYGLLCVLKYVCYVFLLVSVCCYFYFSIYWCFVFIICVWFLSIYKSFSIYCLNPYLVLSAYIIFCICCMVSLFDYKVFSMSMIDYFLYYFCWVGVYMSFLLYLFVSGFLTFSILFIYTSMKKTIYNIQKTI